MPSSPTLLRLPLGFVEMRWGEMRWDESGPLLVLCNFCLRKVLLIERTPEPRSIQMVSHSAEIFSFPLSLSAGWVGCSSPGSWGKRVHCFFSYGSMSAPRMCCYWWEYWLLGASPSPVDAARRVCRAAYRPGRPAVQGDHWHLHPAALQALLRALGPPSDLQVWRQVLVFVLQRVGRSGLQQLKDWKLWAAGSTPPPSGADRQPLLFLPQKLTHIMICVYIYIYEWPCGRRCLLTRSHLLPGSRIGSPYRRRLRVEGRRERVSEPGGGLQIHLSWGRTLHPCLLEIISTVCTAQSFSGAQSSLKSENEEANASGCAVNRHDEWIMRPFYF